MHKIKTKAISVNECWQGRRFKTKLYKDYEEALGYLLPKIEVPEGELELKINVGLSNIQSDLDNCVKPFQDILQKKYGFNDRWIKRLIMEKEKVGKGEEYIEFSLTKYRKNDNL